MIRSRILDGLLVNRLGCIVSRSFSQLSVPVAAVSELRKWTGVSIQKCKQALEASDCDIQKAIEILRKRGESINDSKSSEVSGSSRIAVCIAKDFKTGVLAKASCQTDFASESELFVKFCESLIGGLLVNRGAPLHLLKLDPSFSAQIHSSVYIDVVSEISSILCEPVNIQKIERLEGDVVSVYVHNKSPYSTAVGSAASAVCLEVQETSEALRQSVKLLGDRISRQIIATSPSYIDFSEVPDDLIESKRNDFSSRISDPDKSQKAFYGWLQKFKQDNCLMDMEWIIPSENDSDDVQRTVREVMDMESKKLGVTGVRVSKFLIIK